MNKHRICFDWSNIYISAHTRARAQESSIWRVCRVVATSAAPPLLRSFLPVALVAAG